VISATWPSSSKTLWLSVPASQQVWLYNFLLNISKKHTLSPIILKAFIGKHIDKKWKATSIEPFFHKNTFSTQFLLPFLHSEEKQDHSKNMKGAPIQWPSLYTMMC